MNRYICKQSQAFQQKISYLLPGGIHYNFLTSNMDAPLYFRCAQKSRLWDLDGNEYLDLSMKFGTAFLGHNPVCVSEAVRMEKPPPENSPLVWDVCQLLSQFISWADSFRFGLSGSEMVYNALCLARRYTGKKTILRFNGCYHGTAGGMWGNSDEVSQDSLLDNHILLIPWNDSNALQETVRQQKDKLAAIITEPICVNGGSIMPEPGYLELMRQLCSDYNIVLIFDEIITGIRKGMGVQADYQVVPDLSLWGKCITNGFLPTTVLAGKKELMDLYAENKLVYGGTYNGFTLGLSVMKAVLTYFLKSYPTRVDVMKKRMLKLHNLFKQAAQVTGIPLVIQGPVSYSSFHVCNNLVRHYEALTKDQLLKNSILRSCLQKYGIITAPFSRLYPNLELTDKDLEFFSTRIYAALEDAAAIYHYNKINLDRESRCTN